MRVLSVILVVCAVLIVAGAWYARGGAGEKPTRALYPASEIHVQGPGNTLASVAERVGDPKRFAYDPVTRTATSRCSLIIEGDLRLGREDDPDAGETLEMATKYCGDMLIRVLSGGELRLHHSAIRTESQELTFGGCSRGYAVYVDGRLVMDRSRITYISGSQSEFVRAGSEVRIHDSTFNDCDGNALSLVEADGRRVSIADCEFVSAGNWGLLVQGSGDVPVTIRNCVISGRAAAVFLTGVDPEVHLVDCSLSSPAAAFSWSSGRLRVAWTRRFRVLDGPDGGPVAGVRVVAEPEGPAGVSERVEAVTDERGQVTLALVDWVATPEAKKRQSGKNAVDAYRITAVDDKGEELARIDRLEVRSKRPAADGAATLVVSR